MLRVLAILFVVVSILTSAPAHATANLCAAGKDKCVSKKAAAILNCYGKDDKTGLVPADLASCIQKAKDKFDGGADPAKGCFAKLEAKYPGACLTTGDTPTLEAAVDAFTTVAYCALHPLDASSACSKVMFLTSTNYPTGNINGLAGADAICQTLASNAGLPGTFKAWLSTTTSSAASRLTHSTHPYRLVDGTVVANNWTDLTDGSISVSIHETESGASLNPEFVWTNTNTDGSASAYDCLGWTSSSASNLGDVGGSGDTTGMWTNRAPYYCDGSLFGTTPRALYCFQQ
jgi:hypothetical protein